MPNQQTNKFCKVCKDAGKTEVEYTSHYVRETQSKKSKVTCPLLLNQKCNYCRETGHSIKHCSVLTEKNNNKLNENKRKNVKKETGNKKTETNMFNILDCDVEYEMPIIEYITNNISVKPVNTPIKGFSYANALLTVKNEPKELITPILIKAVNNKPNNKKKRSWVDMDNSDSDSDSEMDDYLYESDEF
jgi:hypothetical protein